jgi:hypothetical protein
MPKRETANPKDPMRIKIITSCRRFLGTSGGGAAPRLMTRCELHAPLHWLTKETAFQTLKDAGIGCCINFVCRGPTRPAQRCCKKVGRF